MTNENNLRRVVITGAPCSGKTTLIDILAKQGFQIIPETARRVIERETEKDSDCLPWRNLSAFQRAVSETQFQLEQSYKDGLVFLDRSIIDGHAYSVLGNIEIPEIIGQIGRGRYDIVFLLEQLPLYKTDSARKENAEQARAIHEQLLRSYREFGYSPILVPVLSPEERVNYILQRVLQSKN